MNTKELDYVKWFLQSYSVKSIEEFESMYLAFIKNIVEADTFKSLSNINKIDLIQELAHMYFVQSAKLNFSKSFLKQIFEYILNISDVINKNQKLNNILSISKPKTKVLILDD